MKNQILAALALVIVLIAVYSNAGNASPQASVTLQSSGVVERTSMSTPTPTGPCSFIISVSASNYQITYGTTGKIDYQSTNATQIVNTPFAT